MNWTLGVGHWTLIVISKFDVRCSVFDVPPRYIIVIFPS